MSVRPSVGRFADPQRGDERCDVARLHDVHARQTLLHKRIEPHGVERRTLYRRSGSPLLRASNRATRHTRRGEVSRCELRAICGTQAGAGAPAA